jgi:hypothetical protein
MNTFAAVSSAGESPRASAPHHVLCAGVLVDGSTLKLLSSVTLEEAPESGILLPILAAEAWEFITSLSSSLETPAAIERALELYLQQRLTEYGLRHSEVVATALVRE